MELFVGVGVPNVGGLLDAVVNVYHARTHVYPSVAFTHIVYGVRYVSPVSGSVFMPGLSLFPLLVCPYSIIKVYRQKIVKNTWRTVHNKV